MKNWFYESNGEACGPVMQVELLRLLLSGKISPKTLVWTPSFGEQWKTAQDAGLTNIAAKIGLLGRFGQAEPNTRIVIEQASLDPNAPKKPVPYLWALILLFLPSCLSLVIGMFSNVMSQPGTANSLITFLLCTIFFLSLSMDRKVLRDTGYTPPSFWWWLFLPGYFIERVRRTRRGVFLAGISIFFAVIAIVQIVWQPNTHKVNELISHITHNPSFQLPIHEDKSGNGNDEGDLSL